MDKPVFGRILYLYNRIFYPLKWIRNGNTISNHNIYFCFMTTNEEIQKTIHQGRNVKRFREMLGIKQEALA